MASVTSLDQDMRKLRLDRYTPGAANEVRQWVEETLGERIASGDLMEALRDGVALCKLVNLVVSPGVRYKASSMPFVQMENISHFLKACELPPLGLPSHDRFLTVDLFDQKDPAQVLQCIAAFSRRANTIKPSIFPNTIGAKSKGSAMSPQGTGSSQTKTSSYTTNTAPRHETPTTFNPLNKSAYSGLNSSGKTNTLGRGGLATGDPVSSWSKQSDEDKTAPAWNIHQYGYMGGASQGNQGVAFGARRQIISTAPQVPSLAEKEKRLREAEAQKRLDIEENERRQRATAEREEANAKEEEERRWAAETKRLKEEEDLARRQEEERSTKQENDARAKEEQMYESKVTAQRTRQRQVSDSRLNGQFLSQYQAGKTNDDLEGQPSTETQKIAELERQLAEMKEAEKRREQLESQKREEDQARKAAPSYQQQKPSLPTRTAVPETAHEDDWDASERDYLKKQWEVTQKIEAEEKRNLPPRPIESETTSIPSARPLPDPTSFTPGTNRTERYLSSNPAPQPTAPKSHRPQDYSTTTEVDLENQRRAASQQKTKAGAWASKSLLEREMERERERQREWEESQKEAASRTRNPDEGAGPGQSWDVHQYGFMGGDSQNRGGHGLGVSGARRQIIGPRPPP